MTTTQTPAQPSVPSALDARATRSAGSSRGRRLHRLAVPMAAVGVLAALPSVAAAGPSYPTANDDATGLVIRADQNNAGSRIGKVPSGASVEVLCQTTGPKVSDSKYGSTTIWDQVRYNGTVGYVTDLYVISNVDRIPGVGACGAAAPAPAPTPAPAPAPAPGAPSTVGGPISRAEVLQRSQPWIDRRVPYSQSQTSTADGHRRDCSGYVSLAWNLNGSPNSTALKSSRYTTPIKRSDLQLGDAIGAPGHIALFVRWGGGGKAVVREEYDYGKVAEERTWSAGRVSNSGAWRYKNIR